MATLAKKALGKVVKTAAADTLSKYESKYDPREAYWVLEVNDKGEKVRGKKKHWSKNSLLGRKLYYPPGVLSEDDAKTLAEFRHWAWIMDMWFTRGHAGLTIGLGALLGLLPVIGDFVDGVVSMLLIEWKAKKVIRKRTKTMTKQEADQAWKDFGEVLWKMRGRVLIASGWGVIPIIGDIFDAKYKANTRNVWILEQYLVEEARKRQQAGVPPELSGDTDVEKGHVNLQHPPAVHESRRR